MEQTIDSAQRPTVAPLTDYEELVWLRHQQGNCTHAQHALVFQLDNQVDSSRVLAALQHVYQALPAINTLYSFDDEQGLIKTPCQFAPIHVHHVSEVSQALALIAQKQEEAFELAAEPALRFELCVLADQHIVIGALMHGIVQGQVSWQQIFSAISAHYNRRPSKAPCTQEMAHLPVSAGAQRELPSLRSLQVIASQLPIVQDVALVRPAHAQSAAFSAKRSQQFVAQLSLAQLSALAAGKEDKASILAAVAALFARQISMLSGHASVQVSLPVDLEARFAELNGSMIESHLARLILREIDHQPFDDLVKTLNAQWAQAAANDELDESVPHVLVTWLADPTTFFRLDGVNVTRLPLAPLHSRFELSLAVGVNCRGEAVLELVTAAGSSPFAGGWLLETLVRTVCGESLARLVQVTALDLPTMPSAEPLLPKEQSDLSPDSDISDITALILNEFRQALAQPQMRASDDFFDCGGHSLIATRVIGRLLSQHQIEVHINDLFSYPSAATLAEHAVRQPKSAPLSHTQVASVAEVTTDETNEQPYYPLSLAQNSLWKAKQKYAEFGLHHIFNIPFALRFVDPVDEVAFGSAFRDLLLRHTGLRTRFIEQQGQAYQQVIPASQLDALQWLWLSSETPCEAYQDALKREASYAFDLANELPLRLKFIRDEQSGVQYLSLLFHHIVLDEWSVNILFEELLHAYQSRVSGQAPKWDFAPLPFHQHAQKQRQSGVDKQHLAFWQQHLHGAQWSEPIFSPSHPLSERHDEQGNEGGWVEIQLEKALSERLYQVAKVHNASLFNVVYAAIISALRVLGAPDNLLVGTPASGRLDADFFDSVGYFTTMVVHQNRLAECSSIAEVIAQVKHTINDSMPYTDIPIDLIEEALLPPGEERDNHIFEVFIQLHAKNKLNGYLLNAQGEKIRFEQVDPDKSEGGLGLQFEVMEERVNGEMRIRVLMSYLTKHYSLAQVELLRQTTYQVIAYFAAQHEGEGLLTDMRQQLAKENHYVLV
ncbi:condensation domain-containing protein [Vibrio cidicii]|uniref:condensation domain-containing protein n=1 Tax=Vibrio cidicii TaxID=1763883 RepID=UPI0018C2315E|nr:condensation domain-containing protein [Vibrio cidicii]MBG0757053.1 hypothetical protein [Vibrio cidicii]